MINLFGPVKISVSDFAVWPQHMRNEFALLVQEKAGTSVATKRLVKAQTAINGAALQRALDQGCRPFSITWSEARAPDTDEIEHPHVKRKGRADG